MITPIGTMTIDQIHKRKDDLLFGIDDVKTLAMNEWNNAIEKFYEEIYRKRDDKGTVSLVDIVIIQQQLIKEV